MTRGKRIAVPDDKVRSREQVLAGAVVMQDHVWVSCWNCGGSGNYPSSMLPPGRCRLYCWHNRRAETFGRLPVPVDKYVKREQARDRREYRAQVRWESERPAREAAARERSERAAREAAERRAIADAIAAEKAARVHVGTVGQRLALNVTVERVSHYESRDYCGRPETRYVVNLRDETGNALVWFTGWALGLNEGERLLVKATVKEHSTYRDEAQTVVTRVARAAVPSTGLTSTEK